MSEGFRVFALDHVHDIRTIRKQLESVRNARCEHILSGAVTDWAQYQRSIGVLEGIDEALHICSEIEKAQKN